MAWKGFCNLWSYSNSMHQAAVMQLLWVVTNNENGRFGYCSCSWVSHAPVTPINTLVYQIELWWCFINLSVFLYLVWGGVPLQIKITHSYPCIFVRLHTVQESITSNYMQVSVLIRVGKEATKPTTVEKDKNHWFIKYFSRWIYQSLPTQNIFFTNF